jgi:hypothetical protein
LIRCMSFSDMDSREKIVLLTAVGLVAVVFVAASYSYLNPPEQVWEAKVFQVFQEGDKTVIYSYGNGKLKLNGVYDVEVGETYRVYYRTRTRNAAEFDIRVEKIS